MASPNQNNPDLKIAQSITLKYINEIAEKLGLSSLDIEHYGKYKAKIPLKYIDESKVADSNLILVTAITPTPAGEGKTTVTVGLNDGLNKSGVQSVAVLREPSLGPVFGVKGGATGGGFSQVVPMEDINLHFTGDFAAIEKANNLLSALINNSIHRKGNGLDIDPRTVTWKWVMDMNDRSLRHVITGLGGKQGGFLNETGFDITAASEVMAALCLCTDLQDLKEKLGNIYIGDTFDGDPVYAKDLKANGAMAVLLKDAINPNLVQTLEGNPAIIHGGPFANIAQGTNSLIATKLGMSLSPYVVTEAGFGADLGAEKFFNIKCRYGNISPKAVVLVATLRALKYHGGCTKDNWNDTNLEALKKGIGNLDRHVANLKKFGIPIVVAVNKFVQDSAGEIDYILQHCLELGVEASVSDGWSAGGEGTIDLAEKVKLAVASCSSKFKETYALDQSIKAKIEAVASDIYGAVEFSYTPAAESMLKRIEQLELTHLPVCIAKTQSSLTDDAKQRGNPGAFTLHIREIEIASGAGFIIPITGKMLRMPGLPPEPSAEFIDIDENGTVVGLS
ncbi:MAG: formate--tetrahydrofolate ligase [Cyclobacteriaceae bacterium]|jgi:formate--tetrahydrofolate ligase